MPTITRMVERSENAQTIPIPKEGVISGEPVGIKDVQFTNQKANFICGVWSCNNGKFYVDYAVDEFIYVISGTAILANEEGESVTIKAGDAIVVPAGFKGTWETVGEVQKYYAQVHH